MLKPKCIECDYEEVEEEGDRCDDCLGAYEDEDEFEDEDEE